MANNEIHELFQKLPKVEVKDRKGIREEILTLARNLKSPASVVIYLSSSSYLVRECAADTLGVINQESCVQYLADLLDAEQDSQVQMAAMYSLRDIKAFSSLKALLEIAQNSNYPELVQSLAIQGLSIWILRNLVSPMFEVLSNAVLTNNSEIMDSIFDAFEILDKDVPDRLLELLRSEKTSDRLRIYIIAYLGERRYAPAFDTILPFLDAAEPDLQDVSATALGKLGIPKVITKLEDKLSSTEDDVIKFHIERALRLLRGDT